jgi:hypothetical protein
MRISVISGICAAFLNVGAVTAQPMDMTIDRLFNICEASDVQAVTVKGDELGWHRQTDAETEEWRSHFIAYNGGSVEVVGWRRDNSAGEADLLSFWVAVGPNQHKACAYSTKRPAGLLNAMSERLGTPDNMEKEAAIEMVAAYWKRGAVEYSFTQIGSSAGINIGSSQ